MHYQYEGYTASKSDSMPPLFAFDVAVRVGHRAGVRKP